MALQVGGGDCAVDFQDFALLGSRWLQRADWDDPNTQAFIDLNNLVDLPDLAALSDQWLACGYPGCETDSSAVDPNGAN